MVSIEEVRKRAEADAQTYGYRLVSDPDLLQGLLEGLKTNEERYGYPSCPCRLASGAIEYDRDIICPCDYRDPDVNRYGACYCRLYLRKDIHKSKELPTVPERRPKEKQARAFQNPKKRVKNKTQTEKEELIEGTLGTQKFWYCKQCGYVVFREDPPYVCPICKAKKEMFTQIKVDVEFAGQ
ncbi:MAG: ferredoxin:glutaredoxin reductase [Candidatus Bathyarchaeota archaeon]|nr:ferredoxin:glutaredoxin reductase [Candidatus Bathyarchaeota archaeon]